MLKTLFALAAIVITANAQAGSMSCQQRYDVAVKQCKLLPGRCMDVSICRHVRENCRQGVDTRQGCEAFKACARKNTPPVFSSVCNYAWQENGSGGACEPMNSITERVALTCPGFNTKLLDQPAKRGALLRPRYGDWNYKALDQLMRVSGEYADPTFSCAAQSARYKAQREICEQAIQYYYQGCATDPSRPPIVVASCDDADLPPIEPKPQASAAPVLKKAVAILVHDHAPVELIPANQALPRAFTSEFANAEDNQQVIEIKLAQVGANGPEPIVDATLSELPPHKAGELRVSIKVTVDAHRKLSLVADVPETGFHQAWGPYDVE